MPQKVAKISWGGAKTKNICFRNMWTFKMQPYGGGHSSYVLFYMHYSKNVNMHIHSPQKCAYSLFYILSFLIILS